MAHSTLHLLLALFLALFQVFSLSPVSAQDDIITYGPHPSDVAPSSFASPEYADMEVPLPFSSDNCKPGEGPSLTDVFLDTAAFDPNALSIFFGYKWCAFGGVRLRALTISGSPDKPVTHVISSEISDHVVGDFAYLADNCENYKAYVEVCGRLPSMGSNARPLCATSRVFTTPYGDVPTPRLMFRPPIKLELAPGDKARIVHRLVNATGRGPLGNGGYDEGELSLDIGSKIESQNGRVLKKPMLKQRKASSVVITRTDSRYPTRKFFNSAKAELVYARPHCPMNTRTLGELYETSITVHKSIKPLVKQDMRLPTFKQPTFKPVKSGSSATITVKAHNNGGGMRKGGAPTELHYQWYLRSVDFARGPTYAEPIKGATSATLKIDKVTCESPNYSRYQVTGLKQYYVDVCNTFGCKRSEEIVPRYITNDGSIITDEGC